MNFKNIQRDIVKNSLYQLKWNILKFQIIQKKAGKEKQKYEKQRINKINKMADLNPNTSITVLNVNGLSRPIKRDCHKRLQKSRTNYMLPVQLH